MDPATERSKKMHVLLVPFFATSHIGPFTDFAVRLATAKPGAVEPAVAVTPANVSVVQSALEQHGPAASSLVKIATYPFPRVDGLPPGVENLSAAGDDGWRIDAAAIDEALTRPAQEALLRERSPDAIVTDIHFSWNSVVAAELGVPCVAFSVIGLFSSLAMRHLGSAVRDGQEVTVPGFPGPEVRIPVAELPERLRCQQKLERFNPCLEATGRCFGLAVNTFLDLEQPYCEMYVRNGYVKRAYFVGPISLPLPLAPGGSTSESSSSCIRWLGTKPSCSVVYICFGTYAAVSGNQLRELALGLEASGKPFLWVVRSDDGWSPPDGWEERVGERGMLVRGWAPQTTILSHPAVGAFLTHCGSSSLLEAAASGVPMLTWPLVFDQFIEERLVTDVLRIGEKVWSGSRSTRYEEREVVPADAVAQAVARFLEPGGTGEAAMGRARELAVKAHAAVAEGGSSFRDLRRLIDDLIEARAAASGTTSLPLAPLGNEQQR
ncbi:UDP-glycosyltransferase 73C4-like [Phragmites australis]|uniref:UDP-glycosyltransferase 73C4-like n=1 Tax=Phragmites australis TaxID=29695 RepID=UPI002D7966AE|nr:UDP-glycosyltransferase 73C4-like [Phragmites australis]